MNTRLVALVSILLALSVSKSQDVNHSNGDYDPRDNAGYQKSFNQLYAESWSDATCQKGLEGSGIKKGDPYFKLCSKHSYKMIAAYLGFKNGIKRCQESFKCHRWNCTTFSNNPDKKLFGTTMARASKEAAVMVAMASAGMVVEMTIEEQRGMDGEKKSCFEGLHSGNSNHHMSHCDADVTESSEFAQKIISKWEFVKKIGNKEKDAIIHNAAVGRLSVRKHMQQVCRCIGPSGACNAKSCYRTLKPLKDSTNRLMDRYKVAKKVDSKRIKRQRDISAPLVLSDDTSPSKDDLIYLLDSPNYCTLDREVGSLGTTGRPCNKCNQTSDSCEVMCCGRGYNAYEQETLKNCNCKFQYCCKIECQQCKRKETVYRCK